MIAQKDNIRAALIKKVCSNYFQCLDCVHWIVICQCLMKSGKVPGPVQNCALRLTDKVMQIIEIIDYQPSMQFMRHYFLWHSIISQLRLEGLCTLDWCAGWLSFTVHFLAHGRLVRGPWTSLHNVTIMTYFKTWF